MQLGDSKKRNNIILDDLVSVKTLQKIQDNLAHALGVSLVIRDSKTGHSITKRSNTSVFCEKMGHISSFAKGCDKSRVDCGDDCVKLKKAYVGQCHAGLYGFAVPIMISGKISAFFEGGQVRIANPDIGQCKQLSEKYGIDFDEYLEAFLSLPLFSKEKLNACVELLSVVANTISNLAFAGEIAKKQATELIHLNDLLESEVMRKTDELRLSEERYRGIFDNAVDVIYSLDSKGIITDINNVVTRSLGYEKDYIIGKHFKDFVCKDDLSIVAKSFDDIKKRSKETTHGLRFRLKTLDGRMLYFELNSRAVYDEDGDLVKIDGILRNINKAFRLEKDLEMVKEKYKELIDSMRDGIYMTDENGLIRVFNKGALRILGYSSLSEIIGKPITDIYVDSDDRKGFLEDLSKNGFLEDYVVKLKRKDGTPIYVEATSNQLLDDEGNVKGVEGVFRDSTEKVKLRKENDLMKGYLENLIEHAGYGIIGVNKKGKVFVWNKGAEEIFGEKSDNAVGRDIFALIPRFWREHRSDLVKQVTKGDVVRDVEAKRTLPDGSSVGISLTLSPIKNEEGKVVGVSAIAQKK